MTAAAASQADSEVTEQHLQMRVAPASKAGAESSDAERRTATRRVRRQTHAAVAAPTAERGGAAPALLRTRAKTAPVSAHKSWTYVTVKRVDGKRAEQWGVKWKRWEQQTKWKKRETAEEWKKQVQKATQWKVEVMGWETQIKRKAKQWKTEQVKQMQRRVTGCRQTPAETRGNRSQQTNQMDMAEKRKETAKRKAKEARERRKQEAWAVEAEA